MKIAVVGTGKVGRHPGPALARGRAGDVPGGAAVMTSAKCVTSRNKPDRSGAETIHRRLGDGSEHRLRGNLTARFGRVLSEAARVS